ncbi:unnamed protein product [Heligmosomoides polygyrus]|uniref:Reverse transcriptase domain-containing protein n=1 Tax=Heligmosomoides polygyrus TaxID=6339 RepID=A0A3P7WSI1_HELPZ|nr:unnamed protein product [Heligmosomoides polygyrus]
MEFPHPAVPSVASVHGPVHKITVEETEAALKKMKPGKATGPDDVSAELWKSKFWYPAEWLAEFLNQTAPITVRLLSHSMEIFERILDSRNREIIKLSDNQCGFVSGCGTIDAAHAARFLLEEHREKQKLVHIAFLDLEKPSTVCRVVAEKVSECWRQSTTIPIWKKKGNPADCSNYRPILLLSHGMKIFERNVDGRIRDIVQLSSSQCGFVAGCGTVDAVHAARLL